MAKADGHYDVIVIGSGFGGSVAAMRAVEKGYSVGVMESGKRWPDSEIPNSSWDITKFLWQPDAEMFGIQRMTYLDDVLVLHGAGVGGGSQSTGTPSTSRPSGSSRPKSGPTSPTGPTSWPRSSTRRSACSASYVCPIWTRTPTA